MHYPEEAIAWSVSALEAMQAAGACYVEVLDTDNGIRYKTTIANYFEHGERFNYGFGFQIKLPLPAFLQWRDLEYMPPTHTDTPAYSEATESKPLVYKSLAAVGVVWNGKQMTLWGEMK